ncbi:hypothetical protein L1049_007139 [Liquidambar formosana]|uniref:Uncharacterized protein n=1 Tax=Liquidambar formosana TaxID=63359 RepID=A0AAP0RGN5_LIQFO
METTSLCSTLLPFRPISGSRKMGHDHRKRAATTRVVASRRSDAHDQNYHGGRLVDENLIVLRKRIHEMKMVERNYEPPSDWMDWEKRYYTSYDSVICEAVRFLQSQLMNTRPSVAIGMVALIILSVTTSTAVLLFHLMEIITKGALAGIHFS